MKHLLPPLGYAYDALEPHIDALTMTIHHTKHHQAYVDNLNAALDRHPELADRPLETLLASPETLPADIRTAVVNNGGGHWNHTFFFSGLKPNQGLRPEGELAQAIASAFGSFEAFREAFIAAAKGRFGSGWVWLVVDAADTLRIVSTPNQDPVFAAGVPVLGLDVWEHAYYLKYQNRRPDYAAAFFAVIDWDVASRRFAAAVKP